MNESVAIRQRPELLCKWCGHPSGPGPMCRACGSPLDFRLLGVQAFSQDLFLHQRLARRRADAPLGSKVEPITASRPAERVRSFREVPARSEIVAPTATEEATDSRSEAEADPGPLLVLETGGWWTASPERAARAALRKEIGRTWATRVGAFFGSIWLLDFLVSRV